MEVKGISKGVRLDGATYQALRTLADQTAEGNASFVVRQLVRKEAAAAGIWPPAPIGKTLEQAASK